MLCKCTAGVCVLSSLSFQKKKKSFLWDLNNGVGVYLPLDCHFCTSSFSTWHLRELLSTCFTPFKRITVNNVAEATYKGSSERFFLLLTLISTWTLNVIPDEPLSTFENITILNFFYQDATHTYLNSALKAHHKCWLGEVFCYIGGHIYTSQVMHYFISASPHHESCLFTQPVYFTSFLTRKAKKMYEFRCPIDWVLCAPAAEFVHLLMHIMPE